jgi:hypothetical protein
VLEGLFRIIHSGFDFVDGPYYLRWYWEILRYMQVRNAGFSETSTRGAVSQSCFTLVYLRCVR